MAKKGTTGGPRAHRDTHEDIKRRSEYKSRAERERMWQKRAIYAALALVVVSALVLASGIFTEEVIRPRQAITTVNGVEISTGDFEKRVAFERWQVAQQIRDLYVMTGGNLSLYGEQFAQQVTNQINSLANPVVFGSPVLDRMEEQVLLEQAAKERGVTVDEAAIAEQVNRYVASYQGLQLPNPDATVTPVPTITLTPLVSPTPTLTRTPTATPTLVPTEEGAEPEPSATPGEPPTATVTPTATATLTDDEIMATVAVAAKDFYNEASDGADVDREVIRDAFYYDALTAALRADLAAEVEPFEFQANVRHILLAFVPDAPTAQALPTEEQKAAALARAEAVMDALQDGESFAALAEAHSDDSTSAASGGSLGWASPDNYVAAFKDAVLTADIGAIVGPVETEYGYHIIQVLGREDRPLSPTELQSRQNQRYETWLTELKANARIQRRDDWIERIPGKPTYNDLLGDIIPR